MSFSILGRVIAIIWFGQAMLYGAPSEVIASVTEVSPLPEPAKNSYPDCDFTAKIKVTKVISGPVTPQEILVVIPGFRNRIANPIAAGVKIKAEFFWRISPENEVDEARKRIQRADYLNAFDLPEYHVEACRTATAAELASPGSPPSAEAKDPGENKSDPVQSLGQSEQRARRQLDIATELAQVDRKLAVRRRNGVPAPAYSGQMKSLVQKKTGFWVKDTMIKAVVPDAAQFGNADTPPNASLLAALQILDRACKDRGIDLMVISLPYEFELYAPYCAESGLAAENSFAADRLNLVKAGLAADIEVIDLGGAFAENLFKYRQVTDVIRQDAHLQTGGVEIVAEVLAKRLARYDWGEADKIPLSSFERHQDKRAYAYLSGNPNFSGEYRNDYFLVNGRGDFIRRASGSPILIVGDSFAVHPIVSEGLNGGLAAHLAHRTGVAPFVFNQFGSKKIIYNLQKDDYRLLAGRKVCILIFFPGYNREYWYYHDAALQKRIADGTRLWKMENFVMPQSADATLAGFGRDMTASFAEGRLAMVWTVPPEAQAYSRYILRCKLYARTVSQGSLSFGNQNLHPLEMAGEYCIEASSEMLKRYSGRIPIQITVEKNAPELKIELLEIIGIK